MQARIVADNKKAADRRIGLSDDVEEGIRTALVRAVVIVHVRERNKRLGHVLPRLSRAPHRRHDHPIWEQSMMDYVGANLGCLLATTPIERTIEIAHAGFGLFGTGMSKQIRRMVAASNFSDEAV
jgi:hypothetical protein